MIKNDYLASLKKDIFIINNFTFHTGEVIADLKVHYAILGNPDGVPVLLLHGTAGSYRSHLLPTFSDVLFNRKGPLDTERYCIIMPDALGHGESSKPSDGLRSRFPQYNYDDMVRAQYLLIRQHLGIDHLRLVMGHSMGGMHAWLWGITYPDFMDALVPMAATPCAMSGRNWILRRMIIDAIRTDPEWENGNYKRQPARLSSIKMWFNFATNGGSIALHNAAPTRRKADALIARQQEKTHAADANDELYWWEASRDYDPAPNIKQIKARVLAINSEDDERNPPELHQMEAAMACLTNVQYHLIPAGKETVGHNTTGCHAGVYADVLKEFLDSLDEDNPVD
ncbi:MAG: hypothetical protein CSB19_02100 [Clostridiales bacterium]|nr:MAG: hypothetical protein CSB19_02100 [Clostridiales bacterium]